MTMHEVFEPERIRALAHPTRLELLDFLRDVREATATECAEHVRESVASCSFHLRILGKYGYIERAEQRGREKPWRAASADVWDLRPSPDVIGSRAATRELASLVVLREGERFRRFLALPEETDPDWADAVTVTTSSFWATAEEMAELSQDLQALATRFAYRSDDPDARPAGSRKAHFAATLNPDKATGGDEDQARESPKVPANE